MRKGFWITLALSIPGALACAPRSSAQARPIDTTSSKLSVHVSKAGLFSAFADNHEIEAPIASGIIDEAGGRVQFVIESRNMKVLDPHLAPDKRQQVQERMLGPEVLDVARFPKINFDSTKVEEATPGHLTVQGKLSLHGVTRLVAATVQADRGAYVGTATLKQQDFGITPIRIGGGTVKVKDELKIDFDIRTNGAQLNPKR